MRLLYYCPEFYYRHGGRTHARGFFNALKKLPYIEEAHLYPKDDPDQGSDISYGEKKSADKLHFLPPVLRRLVRFFRPKRSLTSKLVAEISEHNCDILVIRTGVSQPDLKRIKKACPHVLICLEINSAYIDESFPRLLFKSLFQRWEVSRFASADAISTVSTRLRDYLIRFGVSADKILVNHNGVDETGFQTENSLAALQSLGIPESAFVVGYVGGMESFRRLPEVVGYIADLRAAGHDDIFLVIVGDGRDMPIVKQVIDSRRDDLRDSVVLTGWRSHDEVRSFMGAFDIAIFPFTNDYCSPLKLFEYLAAGLPTIAPDTHAVREVFENGVHLLMARQDGSDFSRLLLTLKDDRDLRIRLGQNGCNLVLSEYTWVKNAERLIDHMMNRRGGARSGIAGCEV